MRVSAVNACVSENDRCILRGRHAVEVEQILSCCSSADLSSAVALTGIQLPQHDTFVPLNQRPLQRTEQSFRACIRVRLGTA